MFLAPVVVFAGIAGKNHEALERQLAPVLAKAGVNQVSIPTGDVAQLARHSDHAKDIVTALGVDGVITGALITAAGSLTFRLVIYDGRGTMRSLDETPLVGAQLTRDDLDVIAMNLGGEVSDLAPAAAPAPARIATPTWSEPPPEPPAARAPIAPEPAPTVPEPVRTADANAVSLDEIDALTSGGPAVVEAAESSATLHLHVGGGFALLARTFTPPTALKSYSSSPVGAAHFEAGMAPSPHTSIDLSADRTLAMMTSLASGSASTVISRWEVTGGIAVVPHVVATLGLGHRGFSIESSDPSRSPDNEYDYLSIGARFQQALGGSFVVHGLVSFEPVFGGTDGMAMALGASTRWGIDLGASLDLKVTSHLVARAMFDYQHFSWAWDAVGPRGANGASDNYPSAVLGLGTEL